VRQRTRRRDWQRWRSDGCPVVVRFVRALRQRTGCDEVTGRQVETDPDGLWLQQQDGEVRLIPWRDIFAVTAVAAAGRSR
jgi:hypothetical protein